MITSRKPSSRLAVPILVGLGIWLSPYPALPETPQVSRALSPILSDYEVIRPETGGIERQVRRTGQLRFHYKERVFDFKLEPHDLRAPNYQAVETGPGGVRRVLPRGPVTTFKGSLEGREDTHGRFSITHQGLEGVVFTAGERYYVEPLQRYLGSAGGTELVVYRHSDVKFGQDWKCGARLPQSLQRGVHQVEAQVAASTATKYQVEVATEADYEYVQALGGSDKANAETLSILNMVDGVYQSELLLELSVTFQNAWTTQKDPYSATTLANLIGQFSTYWINNFAASKDYDVAHMWTGRDLEGNLYGTAWIGLACSNRVYSYALSERKSAVPLKHVLTAHEIGHTVGANHPDEARPRPEGCTSTTMTSRLNSSSKLTFCEYSREEIASHLSSHSSRNRCLTTRTINLQPPSNATAEAVSSAQIKLTWQDNSNNETGFKVHRRLGNSASWNQAGTAAADATTFSDSGLSSGTAYRYRVRAFNSTDSSAFSNEASATTRALSPPQPPPRSPPPPPPPSPPAPPSPPSPPPPAPPPPPPPLPAPSQLTATAVSFSQIDLAWRDHSGNETGFRVIRRVGNSSRWKEAATTDANTTTFSDTGLRPSTRYRYRVQAITDTDASVFSNPAEATTPAAPEPTLTDFTPKRGPVGTAVTLAGTDFLGEVAVGFNGVSAEVEVLSETSLEAVVPPEATSGPISVETVGGTAVSAESFTVTTGIGNRLFVPIVLSSRGRKPGSLFTSEMTLTNRGTTTAAIAYSYRAAFGGGSGTAVDELEPGRQRVIPDAIAYLAGLGVPIGKRPAGGTLAVDFSNLSSPEAAAVTVRVTTPVEEGRAGLAFPGLSAEGLLSGPAFITGLRHNSQDRSNLAVQNAGVSGEEAITLRVTVYSGDPEAPGSLELPDLSLPPGGFYQYNGILQEAGMENGYVKVERVEGTSPYYAYGVINDNSNSDGSFVFPVREDLLVGRRGQTLPVIVETKDFASELTVTNFSPVAKTVDFRFVSEGVESGDDTARFSLRLEAGEQRILSGVVDWMRRQGVAGIGRANRAYVGALFAEVAEGDMSGVVMGARTGAPDQRGGQYSLFYSGVPYGSASVESAWVYGLQQNGENRSNLALVNTGEVDDNDITLEIDIYDGEGDSQPSTRSVLLGPRGWYQLNGILGASGQGYVQVRKVSGSNPFIAYGVINDGSRPGQRSGDGAYLPSRE